MICLNGKTFNWLPLSFTDLHTCSLLIKMKNEKYPVILMIGVNILHIAFLANKRDIEQIPIEYLARLENLAKIWRKFGKMYKRYDICLAPSVNH